MTPEERRKGAFAEFDELLSARMSVEEAIVTAAEDNELKPEVFRSIAEKHLGDLNAHGEKMRDRTVSNHFLSAAKDEVELCKQNPIAYGCTSFIDLEDQIIKIGERLETMLGRPLSEHEIWKIGEILSPAGTHLKLMKFKDPEMYRILLRRELEC